MTDPSRRSGASGRPLRADARRNRDALLASAREAFRAGETEIRVEEIAQRAGVSVGTLYRHFETREAVLAEVYRGEVDELCAAGLAKAGEHGPAEALRLFLLDLVDHAAASRGLAVIFEAIMATASPVFDEARAAMESTMSELLTAGATNGALRGDISGRALLRALSSICGVQATPEWYDDSRRIAGLLHDGLTASAPGTPRPR
ncbi:TetR/AcrR family transcriptional regulator [Amycolatopsis jiangsuensis]|uniref:AcrR family transcriptional regulator n=1 Tax=Amycolatopsis jiangsuensis TaxID=1181879 RepID=A0A840INE2_9PSEU|nr:TetR/AcrR family transcriptional regulator [Amycolatopsis jiangsuensis]MBB4682594.1 AcrR family transcriptional regulator [Amycolatopsis jiangsuensis]